MDGEPSDRLLDCLNRIRWEQDPTLSFRMSCGHGVCGSDGMRIDGVCGLPCQKLVKAFDHEVLIEPLPVFRVIKDLVVDLEPFFEKYRSIKPYLITRATRPKRSAANPRKSSGSSRRRSAASSAPAAPPRAPSTRREETADYVGPAALVRAFRYLFDSRDEGAIERPCRARPERRGLGLPDPLEMHGGLSQGDPRDETDRPDQKTPIRDAEAGKISALRSVALAFAPLAPPL